MKHIVVVLGLLLVSGFMAATQSRAQELLTLQEAVKIALERNYDIKLVANDLRIDQNNVSLGNAGLLPTVTGNLTNNNAIQNSTQTLSNGTTQERNGARNSSLLYGVGLSWTVFDGFGMFARYDQLKEFEKLGETDLQFTILQRIGDVIATYYDIIQQLQQLRANETAMEISRMRMQIAQSRFEIGKASRLEVLNAQVDYNTDTTNLIRQQEQYSNRQIQLNQLLARDVNTPFTVEDTILIDQSLTLEALSELALKKNPSLQAALIQRRIAELDRKQVRAFRYPAISLNTGYNFNRSESALGFATQSTGRGLNYGVTASVNIFNGFNQRRQEKNAGILIENAQFNFERIRQDLESQLGQSFQHYQANLTLVNLEEHNQQIAQKNLDITLEKFKLGSITPIEVREAQLNLLRATVRYSNAQYQAKLAEVDLKELAGNLTL